MESATIHMPPSIGLSGMLFFRQNPIFLMNQNVKNISTLYRYTGSLKKIYFFFVNGSSTIFVGVYLGNIHCTSPKCEHGDTASNKSTGSLNLFCMMLALLHCTCVS